MDHSTRPLVAAAILGAALLGATPAAAQITIDIDVFHDRLSPYGRWIDHDDFGEVWTPYRRDWRPYSEGRWVYTDDYGWLWVEEDDWGWATEHYGRWLYDRAYGWLWVPGFEWAPAWVSWRSAPDYIGWAPLAPRGWRYDDDYDRRRWRFVRGERFLSHNVRTVLIEPERNAWLIERVPVKGEVRRSRDRWENRALEREWVERVTREPVKRVRVRDVEKAQRAAVERDSVTVFRPEVRQRDDRARAERERREERESARGKQEAAREKAAPPPRTKAAERDEPNAVERSKAVDRQKAEPRKVERKPVERNERQSARPQAPARTEEKAAPQRKAAPQKSERVEPRRAPKAQAKPQAKQQPRVAREQRPDARQPAKASSQQKARPDDEETPRSGKGKGGS